ncbi:hypothetical protein QTP86_017939 [Hemibagrus guttatus]|nr:hypothetical protein QTP86_017939 [Hemibagrus guttatus]
MSSLRRTDVPLHTEVLKKKPVINCAFRLSECNVTEKGCSALLTALRSEHSTLKELNLSKNRIQDSGVKLLSEELKNKLCKLDTLSLMDNNIREEGYSALAEALKSSHLIELDLRGNDPGASGVKLLTDLLQDPDCKLNTLRLLKSPDAEEAYTCLTKMFSKNPLLHTELDLSKKKPKDVKVKQLSALLQDPHYRLQKLTMVMADPSAMLCERLTRWHGVCIVCAWCVYSVCIACAASVEDCCLAVGNVVGHENIVSASRMNSVIVVFLNDVEKVRKLTQNGIVVNNETILVSPLSSPAKTVMLSNVPPFISDEAIGKELSWYGRMVSPIKKIPLGCKSPLVKHLVSFRRMVFMVFKEGVSELNVVFKFTVEGLDYNIFVSSDTDIKCFKCGQTGHLARACPERSAAPDLTESEPQDQPAAQTPTGATPAPEKPRTAELATAEPRSARPDRKKPWSTEKRSVGSGAVLEPPAPTEAGTEVQGNRMETPDTTPVQGDGETWTWLMSPFLKYQIKGKNKYTLNVTRDIVRSLKALEIEIVELQRLKATGDQGHIEALKSKKDKMNDLLDITAQGALVHSHFKSAAESFFSV